MKMLKSRIFMFILGLVIAGGVSVFAYQMNATQITYEPKDTSWKVTTVKGAIDDIKEDIDVAIEHSPVMMQYAFGNVNSQSTTEYKDLNRKLFIGLYGTQKSVCIIRNNKLNCFANNNTQRETTHIAAVFSDARCNNEASSGRMRCNARDFICDIYTAGHVYCRDYESDNACYLDANGTIDCSKIQ